MLPFVSVLTPTHNRRFFLEQLLRNYAQQDYPAARRELLVLDDGSDRVEDVFSTVAGVRYVRSETVDLIGKKRNRMIDMARGDVLVHMDDDDYYPPARISSAVSALGKSGLQLAGASRMLVMRAGETEVASVGPYGAYHATGNTFAYTKAYTERNRYLDEARFAEEVFFTAEYTNPMVQLPALSTVLAIAHTRNTVPKGHIKFAPARERFKDLVKEPLAREFYRVKLPAFLAAHPRSLVIA